MRKSAYFRSAEAKTKLPYDARRVLVEEGFKKYPILTLLFINSALYENNVQFVEAYCVFVTKHKLKRGNTCSDGSKLQADL